MIVTQQGTEPWWDGKNWWVLKNNAWEMVNSDPRIVNEAVDTFASFELNDKKVAGAKMDPAQLRKVAPYLTGNEKVESLLLGHCDGGLSVLALTTTQFLLVKTDFLKTKTEEYAFSEVSDVVWTVGLMTGTFSLKTIRGDLDFKYVRKETGASFYEAASIAINTDSTAKMQRPVNAGVHVSQNSVVSADQLADILDMLNRLRLLNVLTEEEFLTKKQETINRT